MDLSIVQTNPEMPFPHKVRKPYLSHSRPLKESHLCRNLCFSLHDDSNILDIFETYPEHPRILQMKRDVTQVSLSSLEIHINEWLNAADSDSLEGPPGYGMGALEPVLRHAIQNSIDSMVSYLMQRGVRLCDKALWEAIESDASEAVFQAFLDNGWDINKSMGPNKPPPLGLVLDKLNLLCWFLDHGADPNAESEYGISPFMEAAAKAPLEIVQLLHQRGALPGNTAPSAAKSRVPGRPEVLKFLLDIGAPIDAIEFQHNPKGYASDFNVGSALNLACCWTSQRSNNEGEAMVEMLLARGAKTNVVDFSGRTALDLAKDYGTQRMVELIQHHMNQQDAAEMKSELGE